MIYSAKGKVAVEPFPDMSVKTTAQGAGSVKVARIETKVALVPLKVVWHSEDGRFFPTNTVYVKGSHFTQPWAKEVHEIDGEKFILIPDSVVEAVNNGGYWCLNGPPNLADNKKLMNIL
jgi:hypothetical protein